MSELESLCRELEESVRPLPTVVSTLQQRAARLRSAAAQVEQAARQLDGSPGASRIVRALEEAAAAMDASSRSITVAIGQSRSFVSRTIGGGGGPAPGATASSVVGVSVASTGAGVAKEPPLASAPKRFVDAAVKTKGGAAYFGTAEDQAMRDSVHRLPDYPDEFVADLHGKPGRVELYDADGATYLSAQEFAEVLRRTGWSGEPVRLFSCHTGADPEGFAQQLARELGVRVIAPDLEVWSPTGWVGSRYLDESDGIPVLKERPGDWHAFDP